MIPAGKKDDDRVLKPGDLYIALNGVGFAGDVRPRLEIGNECWSVETGRMRLVERHPCGELEFLILPPETT